MFHVGRSYTSDESWRKARDWVSNGSVFGPKDVGVGMANPKARPTTARAGEE